jgi:hypothetical protein
MSIEDKILHVAIDPGVTGGIALQDWVGNVYTYEMKNYMKFITSIVDELDGGTIVKVMIERQQCSQRQGVSQAFKTGFGFGQITGWFEGLSRVGQVEVVLVQPKKWMASLRIAGGMERKARKQAIADKVSKIYPEVPMYGPRGGLIDGISDALGILAFHTGVKIAS